MQQWQQLQRMRQRSYSRHPIRVKGTCLERRVVAVVCIPYQISGVMPMSCTPVAREWKAGLRRRGRAPWPGGGYLAAAGGDGPHPFPSRHF